MPSLRPVLTAALLFALPLFAPPALGQETAGTQVVADTAPPEVRAVRLRGNRLEIEFSEEPDLATLSAISVEAPEPPVWTLKDDSVTVTTQEPLPAGERQVTIGTGLADLAGRNLAEPFSVTLGVPVTLGDVAVFEAEEDGVVDFSSVGNRYGFHGRPVDPETGLLYVRNRYYDPELGLFLTPDPLGYVDGPSMYAYSFNNPVSFRDPLGLAGGSDTVDDLMLRLGAHAKEDSERRRLEARLAAVRSEIALRQATADYLKPNWGHHGKGSKHLGLAAHLRAQGLVTGPSYEVHTEVGRLLGTLPCDRSREVLCHFQGLADPLYIVESPVYFSTMFLLPSVQAPLAARPGILMPGRGGAMVAFEEAVPLFVPRAAAGAESAVNARLLAQQLTRQEASSVFMRGGALHPEVVAESRLLIRGNNLRNPAVIRELTADGSNIADWAKFSTETFRSPSGAFQVHFYRNTRTGAVSYSIDYKAVFNRGVQP